MHEWYKYGQRNGHSGLNLEFFDENIDFGIVTFSPQRLWLFSSFSRLYQSRKLHHQFWFFTNDPFFFLWKFRKCWIFTFCFSCKMWGAILRQPLLSQNEFLNSNFLSQLFLVNELIFEQTGGLWNTARPWDYEVGPRRWSQRPSPSSWNFSGQQDPG